MNCAVLFSGGKDSTYAAYIAKKKGYKIKCLISIISENTESYMFHTPSINKVNKQAEVMDIPLLTYKTKGEKEKELIDLKKAIQDAKEKYNFDMVVTGAVESNYQKSRIENICRDFKLKCFNPIWKKNQIKILKELIENNFFVTIIGVFAYPLNEDWLGRKIDDSFIKDMIELNEKYKINPAGEGGEYETFVLNCPIFKRELKIIKKEISGSKNSWKIEIDVE